jgi:hypothetical protein
MPQPDIEAVRRARRCAKRGQPVEFRTVVLLGVVVSLALSATLSLVILPPTRGVLQRVCPSPEVVTFWTRFSVLMLFLGPLLVVFIFGLPYSDVSAKLAPIDLIVRVVSSALVGGFLTVGGIGLRMGTLRPDSPLPSPPLRKSDDERIR